MNLTKPASQIYVTFVKSLAYLFLLPFLFFSLTNFLLSIAVASRFLVEENSVDGISVESDSPSGIPSTVDSFLADCFYPRF